MKKNTSYMIIDTFVLSKAEMLNNFWLTTLLYVKHLWGATAPLVVPVVTDDVKPQLVKNGRGKISVSIVDITISPSSQGDNERISKWSLMEKLQNVLQLVVVLFVGFGLLFRLIWILVLLVLCLDLRLPMF